MAMRVKKSVDRSETNLTVRAYLEKMEDKNIIFDIDMQRPYVWKDLEQKSRLIQSLILNDIVPPFVFNKIDGDFEGIDSKQRSLTIYNYVHDGFALKGICLIEVINDNGELEERDINGLKFSELDDCFKNAIMEYNLSIWYLDEASQEVAARNFYNLNNGTKINAATMSRINAKSKEQIGRLSKHKIFKEALSKIALEGHVNDDLVAKAHAILNDENVSMNAAWVRKYMRDADITEKDEEQLNEIFNRIYNIHALIEDNRLAKRIYMRTHMISIVPIIDESIKSGLSDAQMMEWFVSFYRGNGVATTSKIYNSAAGSGSGKNIAVKRRVEEIKKSYRSYFFDKEKEVEVLMKSG